MYMQVQAQVQTWFKLEVRKKADDSLARETVWFPNIVLDSGLDQMGKGTWIQYCFVGTGNSKPVPEQTQLDSAIASTQDRQNDTARWLFDQSPVYLSRLVTWRFGEGVAKGNIAEIGLGWITGGSKPENYRNWNRALLLDADGQPTTLTVLADEYLDVFSEIRFYPAMEVTGAFDLVDKTGKVLSKHTFKGIPHIPNSGTWGGFHKVGLHYGYTYSGNIPTNVTNAPSGRTGQTSPTPEYPNPRTCRAISVFGLNQSNGTVKSLMQLFTILSGNSQMGYQIEIDPPFEKNATQMLTFVSDLTWSRYEGG